MDSLSILTSMGLVPRDETALAPEPQFRIQKSALRTTIIICLVTALVVSLSRFIVRFRMMKKFCPDDYAIMFGLTCFTAYCSLYLVGLESLYLTTTAFYGFPVTEATLPKIKLFLRLQFSIILLFWTNLWSIKLAFLLMFQRFIYVTKGSVHSWIYSTWVGALVLIFLTFWANVGLQLGSCQPVSNFFEVGKCSSAREIFMSNLSLRFGAACDITTDVVIIIVPLILLRYINVSKRQKVALACIFSIGGFVITFSILRIVMINPATNQADPIWLAFWTVLESTVAIIVCSLPTFRSLIGGSRKDSQQPVATIRGPIRRRRGIDNALDEDDEDEIEACSKMDLDQSRTDRESVDRCGYDSELGYPSAVSPSSLKSALGKDEGSPTSSSFASADTRHSPASSPYRNTPMLPATFQFPSNDEKESTHNTTSPYSKQDAELLAKSRAQSGIMVVDGIIRRIHPDTAASRTGPTLPAPVLKIAHPDSSDGKTITTRRSLTQLLGVTIESATPASPIHPSLTTPDGRLDLTPLLETPQPAPFHPITPPPGLQLKHVNIPYSTDIIPEAAAAANERRFIAVSTTSVTAERSWMSPSSALAGLGMIHITRDVQINEVITGP